MKLNFKKEAEIKEQVWRHGFLLPATCSLLLALSLFYIFPAAAQSNNAAVPLDFSTVARFIAQRNIFDPNRLPVVGSLPPRPRPIVRIAPTVPQADSFSLVGVIGYGEGRLAGVYAFFNGSSSQYQKTAQVNDSIATFKVAAIAADSVTLVSGTNKMVLGIGEQLHDDGGGHWLFANGTTVSYNNVGGFGNRRNGRNGFGNGAGGGNGFGNGGRRRNNFGNGNNGNFNTGGNNFAGPVAADDNSQADDQDANSQDDNAPDDSPQPGNMAPSDDNNAPDAGAQDNTDNSQTDPSQDSSGDSTDPIARLKAARAAELQQIGH